MIFASLSNVQSLSLRTRLVISFHANNYYWKGQLISNHNSQDMTFFVTSQKTAPFPQHNMIDQSVKWFEKPVWQSIAAGHDLW